MYTCRRISRVVTFVAISFPTHGISALFKDHDWLSSCQPGKHSRGLPHKLRGQVGRDTKETDSTAPLELNSYLAQHLVMSRDSDTLMILKGGGGILKSIYSAACSCLVVLKPWIWYRQPCPKMYNMLYLASAG